MSCRWSPSLASKCSLQLILGSSVHNTKQSINNFAGQGPFVSEKITIEVISSE